MRSEESTTPSRSRRENEESMDDRQQRNTQTVACFRGLQSRNQQSNIFRLRSNNQRNPGHSTSVMSLNFRLLPINVGYTSSRPHLCSTYLCKGHRNLTVAPPCLHSDLLHETSLADTVRPRAATAGAVPPYTSPGRDAVAISGAPYAYVHILSHQCSVSQL